MIETDGKAATKRRGVLTTAVECAGTHGRSRDSSVTLKGQRTSTSRRAATLTLKVASVTLTARPGPGVTGSQIMLG